MCKVQDVADFFVDSALSDPEDNMTNMRVKAYFESLPPLQEFSMPDFSDDVFIGYRDNKTGNYVLPENKEKSRYL